MTEVAEGHGGSSSLGKFPAFIVSLSYDLGHFFLLFTFNDGFH